MENNFCKTYKDILCPNKTQCQLCIFIYLFIHVLIVTTGFKNENENCRDIYKIFESMCS